MELMKSGNERRSKRRFAIARDMRYKMAEENGVVEAAGSGETIDIGSGGVAFLTKDPLRPGALVELSISWPVLLQDACPLRLVVFGRIVRCTGRKAVCTIDKYEFRTQARTFRALVNTRGDGMLQRWADALQRENFRTSTAGV